MSVAIDETRQQGGVAQVEYLRVRRRWPTTGSVDGGDAIALDQYFLVRARLCGRAVDECAGPDDHEMRRCGGGRRSGGILCKAQPRHTEDEDAETNRQAHWDPF